MTCREGKHYTCDTCNHTGTCAEFIAPIFERYEAVRKSGRYNMVTDMDSVMKEIGLDPGSGFDRPVYFRILENYGRYVRGDFG